MKNIIPKMVPTLHLFSSSLLLFLSLVCPFPALTAQQRTTIVLSQEIKVPEGATISSYGPGSVRVNGRGMINSRHQLDKYVVSGRESSPHVFVINKTMAVNSWQQNTVKQVVTLVVDTENSDQLADLRQALHPNLTLTPVNEIRINYELNIAKFTLNNGWFQEDNNSITLTNGKVYPVKYLEIKNEIFLPENANLNFNLIRTNLSMDDHQGNVEITMNRGKFSAGRLHQVSANITDGNFRVSTVENAEIISTNSQLSLGLVGELELSSSLSTGQVDSTGLLKLTKSLSDNLSFHEVGSGAIYQSVFSTLTIGLLKTSLLYSGRSSHLKVLRVSSTLRSFQASSQDGSISFPLKNLPSARLECSNVKGNQFLLPPSIPKPGKELFNYNFQWGSPTATVHIKLGGERCQFHLHTDLATE